MKKESSNYQERYFKWKDSVKDGIPNVNKENSDLILKLLTDFEKGLNTSNASKKGARSFARLTNIKDRLIYFDKNFKQYFNLGDITKISEEQLLTFFNDMRIGKIRKNNGGEYKSVADYVKSFKTFWHWYMKESKKEGKDVNDITIDLDTKRDKAPWVYLIEDDLKKLCDKAKYEYKVLMWFLFDSGLRPKELINIRVCDLYENCKKLNSK